MVYLKPKRIAPLLILWYCFNLLAARFTIAAEQTAWAMIENSYKEQKFEAALNGLTKQPSYNAYYFYNLGTLWAKMGNYGTSTAFLEKANRLKPHDADIQFNLQIAKSHLERKIGSDLLDPASTSLEAIADRIPTDEVKGVLGLLSLIFSLFLLRPYLKTRNLIKTLLHPAGWFAACAFMLTLFIAAAQGYSTTHPPAICIQKQIVRSGPGDDYLELTRLEAGIKVRVIGPMTSLSNGEIWQQIRYKNNAKGWVLFSTLLPL